MNPYENINHVLFYNKEHLERKACLMKVHIEKKPVKKNANTPKVYGESELRQMLVTPKLFCFEGFSKRIQDISHVLVHDYFLAKSNLKYYILNIHVT